MHTTAFPTPAHPWVTWGSRLLNPQRSGTQAWMYRLPNLKRALRFQMNTWETLSESSLRVHLFSLQTYAKTVFTMHPTYLDISQLVLGFSFVHKAVADLGGRSRRPPPPPAAKFFSISCSFQEHLIKFYPSTPISDGWRPSPYENPGSVTAKDLKLVESSTFNLIPASVGFSDVPK